MSSIFNSCSIHKSRKEGVLNIHQCIFSTAKYMSDNLVQATSFVRLTFIENAESSIHIHEDIQLLYVIQGSMNITIEDKSFFLTQEDIIVINSNQRHYFNGSKSLFLGQFNISYAKISELLNQNLIYFSCNSTIDKNDAYGIIKTLINHILGQHLQKETNSFIYLNSLYYQLLHVLTSNFLLTEKDIRFEFEKSNIDNRMQEILHFLRINYDQRITLQDLSNKFYLSPAYLSKYIRIQSNLTFLDLITAIRLNHAVKDLLHTDYSIMKIAMKNGFASVSAFNKSFKDKYDCIPSEFQKRETEANSLSSNKNESKKKTQREKLHSYLVNTPDTLKGTFLSNKFQIEVNLKDTTGTLWNQSRNHMINVGTASDLLRSVFREHILYLKENLGFKYIRFWNLYSPDMLLDIHSSDRHFNFGRLDSILDFLVINQLKPYIELGFKPIRLLKNTQSALFEISPTEEFKSFDQMEDFYYQMTLHLVERYGAEEVKSWYFEFWKEEDIKFIDLTFNFAPQNTKRTLEYLKKFNTLSRGIKRCLPGARIGGGGFSVQHYGEDNLHSIFNEWKNIEYPPDFISINCYPYTLERSGNIYFEKKSTDMFFVKHNIEIVLAALAKSNFIKVELHVSEYSLTLSNRNAINDSCQKAAFLMQSLISNNNNNNADIIGYWLGSDVYADFNDTQNLIFGGCGLLTKNGLPKPSAYAFKFINQQYKNFIKKDRNYLITNNSQGSWKIACHNFKNFSYNYYALEEQDIGFDDIQYMIEDDSNLSLKYHLDKIENGTYFIKIYSINNDHGSIQNELSRLELNFNITHEEQNYLDKITTPKLSSQKYLVDHHKLDFETVLNPNEIQYIHITFHQ